MAQVSIVQMKALVESFLSGTTLAEHVRDVAIELPGDVQDDDIVRVTIFVDASERIGTRDAVDVTRRLQDVVMEADDRFPSISFADAA